MLNKTLKIIIIGIVIVILLFAAFFMFKSKNSVIDNKAKETEATAKLFEELKTNHPEFSVSQLEFYNNVATKSIGTCTGRNDENDCTASVAFLKSMYNTCNEISDEKIKIECANAILSNVAVTEIDKCQSLAGDSYMNCLKSIFIVYNKSEDCLSLKPEKAKQLCEGVIYYNEAFIQRNTEVCKKTIDTKLAQYCVDNINAIDKSLDSDNDGLTDYDEKNVYKTDPKNPDTDRDGYSDGEEVKTGHNPLGK